MSSMTSEADGIYKTYELNEDVTMNQSLIFLLIRTATYDIDGHPAVAIVMWLIILGKALANVGSCQDCRASEFTTNVALI